MLRHRIKRIVSDIRDGDAMCLAEGLVDNVGARCSHRDELESGKAAQGFRTHRYLVGDSDSGALQPVHDLSESRAGIFLIAVREF